MLPLAKNVQFAVPFRVRTVKERTRLSDTTAKSIGSSVRSSLGLDCAEASTAAEHQICASGTNDTVYVTTRHALATVAHRALRSDRFLTWQRPDSPISDVGAMQGGRLRKSLLQGDRWLEGCLMRCPSACGVAKLAAVKNWGSWERQAPLPGLVCIGSGSDARFPTERISTIF